MYDNADAGLAMLESFNADISGNTFSGNKYGIRMSVGCADNVSDAQTKNVTGDIHDKHLVRHTADKDSWNKS